MATPPRDDLRDLLRCLAMPFQPQGLMFVALTSVLLGLFLGGGLIRLVLCIFGIWLVLVWLTQYAVHIIDDAANGVREAQAASVEMATGFLDARAWVHPTLAVAIAVLLYLHPAWPRMPVLVAVALLFPASLGASVMTGHALQALNPAAVARTIQGLGLLYPVLVLFVLGCMLVALVAGRLDSTILTIAVIEMSLLVAYAGIGGALYRRRTQLGFEPRWSPERLARRQEDERLAERQRFIDELYRDLRVRETSRATDCAARWLRGCTRDHLQDDLQAIVDAGRRWSEPREFPRMLRALIPVMLEMKQPALAFTLAEAGLSTHASFAPATEAETVAMIRYARETGRRRAARQLLENCLGANAAPGPQLLALKTEMEVAAVPGRSATATANPGKEPTRAPRQSPPS